MRYTICLIIITLCAFAYFQTNYDVIGYYKNYYKEANTPEEFVTKSVVMPLTGSSSVKKSLSKITGTRNIAVNPPTEYNYKSKAEIFNIRKKYVAESIFAYEGYEPSDAVFGQIVDGLPWKGLKYYNCHPTGQKDIALGASEESRFVNNPATLVGIEAGCYHYDDPKAYKYERICQDTGMHMLPGSIKYDGATKTITTIYNGFSHFNKYYLNGVNARDFGFQWVYADKMTNAYFRNNQNISNSIYKFRDFIHKGGSCGLASGCNNGSPDQDELDIALHNGQKDAIIHFKLWLNQPESYNTPADINYQIVILN